MKQYVVDELRPEDYKKIKRYLDQRYPESPIDGIYWVPLEDDLLEGLQIAHGNCQPYFFALELESDRLSCELLVRTHERIRCDCIRYASAAQRTRLIDFIDAIFEELHIIA